jgi:hypothetical protein
MLLCWLYHIPVLAISGSCPCVQDGARACVLCRNAVVRFEVWARKGLPQRRSSPSSPSSPFFLWRASVWCLLTCHPSLFSRSYLPGVAVAGVTYVTRSAPLPLLHHNTKRHLSCHTGQ